jgi:hypothetical protein
VRSRLPFSSIATAAALLLGAGLLALLPAGPAGADPAFQQPVAGSCYAYPAGQLRERSDPSAPVSCAGPHTAQAIAVIAVDPSVPVGKAARRYLPQCYAAMRQALGGDPARIARTAYGITLFGPDAAQLAAGARWLRCDLVLPGGRRLEQLPTPLLAQRGRIPASVERCASKRGTQATVCSRPHTQRAGRAVVVKGSRWPGRVGFQRRVRCGAGATLSYPGKVQWKAGLRAAVCLVPDRR